MAVLKDLIVHGSSRFLNAAYYNKIKANSLAAEDGYFNKLVAISGKISDLDVEDLTAQNATVIGLLDVKGELHTNSWTNSNIATIDGSFYITPTVSCESGTFAYDGTNITVTAASGYSFGVNSLYTYTTDGVATTYTTWPESSRVLLTGEVKLNGSNEWQPLGTIRGQIVNSSTSSIKINSLKDSQGATPITTLVSLGSTSISNASFRKVKVSLYERASGSTFFPIGIYMTALGEKGKTFIDIYGGGDAKASVTTNNINSGAMAKPVLRIGNLSGLPILGTVTPAGWGIYTTNGFFSGTMVAKQGIIGEGTKAWTIGKTSGTGAESFLYAPTTGPQSPSANTVGIYIGTDGINNYASSTQYVRIYGGKIYAQGVDITGKITASSGLIGGWNIGTDANKSLYYGGTTPSATNLVLSKGTVASSTSVGGSTGSLSWMILAGNKFGVTTGGVLYASEANISGAINATSLNVGSASSSNHLIYNSTTNTIDLSTDWLKFVNNAVIIGKDDESHISIDYHSFTMQDSEDEFFRVEDKRNNQGIATITDTSPVIEKYNSWQSSSQYKTIVTDCYPEEINSVIIQNAEDLTQTTDATENNNIYTQNATYLDNLRFDRSNLPYTKNIIKIEYTTTEKAISFTFGSRNSSKNVGKISFASGSKVIASGSFSHVEGGLSEASGSYSHAEGTLTIASGQSSHAEGNTTKAAGIYSHAEGSEAEAMGQASHAEGYKTIAYGSYSHAEGNISQAFGESSHAQGDSCWTYGDASFATGIQSAADGEASNALGEGAYATKKAQTVIGTWCNEDTSTTTTHSSHNTDYGTYALIVGNGEAYNTKSNALTVDWKGVVSYYGDVTNTSLQIPPNSSTISSVTYAANSGGKITEISFTKKGNLAMIRFQVTSTSAISSGSNILTAQLVSKYHPAQYTTGVGYYGGHAIVGRINASGQLIIRNASSSGVILASSNGGVEVAFTYILKDYFV